MVRTTAQSEELVRAYVDAWNEQNYSAIGDVVSESVVARNPTAPGGVVHGRDELEAFMRGVIASFPDFHVSVLETLADAERVMYEAKLTMTHEGEFDGIPPTGREVEVREMAAYRIADEEVQEYRVYFDLQEVLAQLGLSE
ncbi:ester cyclase [Halobium palmae]|uniref:Ester cyclase n=1 Tax=Halobium palmae TaxID=1776492 RepID=A0ABD5S065_9EURY